MRAWIVGIGILVLVGCGEAERGVDRTTEAAPRTPGLDSLARLYGRHDYFRLREELGESTSGESATLTVLRAATALAFNQPAHSDSLVREVLAGDPGSDSLRYEARRIAYRARLRLHRYPAAGRALEELLADLPSFVDSAQIRDYRNMLRLTNGLAETPPQRVLSRSATVLERDERGHVPLQVDGAARAYLLDTGANYSALIRSEAEGLGLEIRPADLEVGTSTDATVTVAVAVADSLRIGGVLLSDVVFLVLPDEALTFPGLVIRGIVGFPVIEALGEVRFEPDGGIEIPDRIPERNAHNLALQSLTPLVRVESAKDTLVCGFDTGANRTQFYEPFYRENRARIEEEGMPDTLKAGGAGGIRELPGYRLPRITLRVAGDTTTLSDVHVHTRSLTRLPEDNVLDCNLGQDVLDAFGGYTVDFRNMAFTLE
jgi:hypothetical protein